MCMFKKPKTPPAPAPAPVGPEASVERIDVPEEVRGNKAKRSGRSSLRIPRTSSNIGGTGGGTGLNIPI